MTKIVNLLSAKMEMGLPMISIYLLGNPDHYKSHKFHPFCWQPFVQESQKPWVHADHIHSDRGTTGASNAHEDSDVAVKVALCKHNGRIVGLSPVHDYVFCPGNICDMCLYDWIQLCEHEKNPTGKHKRQAKQHLSNTNDSTIFDYGDITDSSKVQNQFPKHTLLSFQGGHPPADSHGIQCHSPSKAWVPNFVGATLPHFDQGDHEFYCSTMLMFSKPWRSGLDLKQRDKTWDDAFSDHPFSP
ncbi:hypothetical protein L208DRAFT_1282681 [Tricholoma matsutake]|nr:hypothetical protein L208DRAFT_1282681 [Tricholoma matsutake 945]